MRPELQGERAREAADRPLRRRVARALPVPAEPRGTGDVHDAAAAPRDQVRDRVLARQERPDDVQVEDRAELLDGVVLGRRLDRARAARGVDRGSRCRRTARRRRPPWRRPASSSVTSHVTTRLPRSGNFSSSRAACSSSAAVSRPTSATWAPSRARCSVTTPPMPLAAPVTIGHLPGERCGARRSGSTLPPFCWLRCFGFFGRVVIGGTWSPRACAISSAPARIRSTSLGDPLLRQARARPGDADRAHDRRGASRIGDGDAPHAQVRLLERAGPPAGADLRQLGAEQAGVGDRVVAELLERACDHALDLVGVA